MNHAILVIGDEARIGSALHERLEGAGHRVVAGDTAEAGLERLRHGVDLVILACAPPNERALDLIRRLREQDPYVPVVVAQGPNNSAAAALRAGASCCAREPLDLEEVLVLVEQALETAGLRREVRWLRRQAGTTEGIEQLIGESERMQQAKSMLRKIAESPAATLLLTGELGTGKATAGRAIHAQSDRREQPFMSGSCAALPERLLESELFGHERGAFSSANSQKKGLLELAAGGTMLLEDVIDLSPSLQIKLLRFLQERAFRRVGGSTDLRPDVRVVAATHQDLQEASRRGAFSAELFYRLAVLHVHLPPLRERAGDILLLANAFTDRFKRRFRKPVRGFSPGAVQLLEAHPWPGNVHELHNALERAVLLCDGDTLDRSAFERLAESAGAPARFELPRRGVDMGGLERDLVHQALDRTGGNQTQAAVLLGLTRDQVRYRMVKYKLTESDDDPPEDEASEPRGRPHTRAG